MKELNIYEVLRRPLITEKGSVLQSQGKYIFEVSPLANKHQVKQAVEAAFKVGVTAVNMIKMPGKTRRSGRKVTTTSPWKKAVVSLKAGDKIEFFEGV
jgi:large subunit ribosomal protein L23